MLSSCFALHSLSVRKSNNAWSVWIAFKTNFSHHFFWPALELWSNKEISPLHGMLDHHHRSPLPTTTPTPPSPPTNMVVHPRQNYTNVQISPQSKPTVEYSFLRKFSCCSLGIKAMNTFCDNDSPSGSSVDDKWVASFRRWTAMVTRLSTLRRTKQSNSKLDKILHSQIPPKLRVRLWKNTRKAGGIPTPTINTTEIILYCDAYLKNSDEWVPIFVRISVGWGSTLRSCKAFRLLT